LEEAYLATQLSAERATVVAADLMRTDVTPLAPRRLDRPRGRVVCRKRFA